MTPTAERLYNLLPAVYRVRDAERGGPLEALVEVLAEGATVLEESLDGLYDDAFIETCAPWAVPYVGDLIGHEGLHGVTASVRSPRAEVANTIGYRRRKGTAAVLEALARDVTGWPAFASEFFERLVTTQHLNHVRPAPLATVDVRDGAALARALTPFTGHAYTADVRRMTRGHAAFNVPNVGLYLWRLGAHGLTNSPAFRLDERRFLFSPLGHSAPLFNRPDPEDAITHLAGPANVPAPFTRRALAATLDAVYGRGRSFRLETDGVDVPDPDNPAEKPSDRIRVCDLSDVRDAGGNVTGWAHLPDDKIAVDPVLGRIVFPPGRAPAALRVSFHHGFADDTGGGEYERAGSFEPDLTGPTLRVPGDHATIQAALNALPPEGGAVEVTDSGRYEETPAITAAEGARIELRAANGRRPTLVLAGDFDINGAAESEVTLNGLLVTGGTVRAGGLLRRLRLCHLTLVPGLALGPGGAPASPDAPAFVAEPAASPAPLSVRVERSITGPLRLPADGCELRVTDSLVDAPARGVGAASAYAIAGSDDGATPGAPLTIERTTVFGRVHVQEIVLASDVIFDGEVVAVRRQRGCVRFCHVPVGSKTPRRYRCAPATEADSGRVRPHFTSTRYGDPGYGQLGRATPPEIRTGASDESEMGAFHDVFAPQREANLRARLDEYLRFGLEAGVFFAS